MLLDQKETGHSENDDTIAKLWKFKVPVQPETPPLWKSFRLKVIGFGCMVMCASFASQASMTSAIVCMIDDDNNNNNNSSVAVFTFPNHTIYNNSRIAEEVVRETAVTSSGIYRPSEKARDEWVLSWSPETQGWVVSAFFMGYYVMQMPSGVIVTRLGPKSSLTVGLLVGGILHLLSVPAARWNMPLLYLIRALAGLACGCMVPGTYALVANWCPAQESSFLFGLAGVGVEMGNTLSFLLALIACGSGFQGGWPIIFYSLGGFMVLMALIMAVAITDFPYNNKFISTTEARYISSNRAHGDTARNIPFRRILLSPQVWAFLVAQLAIEWMYYTFITQGPIYLRDVIKLPPWKTNLLASIPFLIIIPIFLVVGYACDKVIQKKMASKTTVRKFNGLYATVFTAVPMLCFGFLPEGAWGLSFVIYTVAAIGICGTYAGYMANPGDLSPAHAGFMASLGQTLTMWVAFAIPPFTGYLTQQKDRASWQTVFYIVVGLELFCCVFYMIFGSGELQPWAVEEEVIEISEERMPLLRDTGQKQKPPQ